LQARLAYAKVKVCATDSFGRGPCVNFDFLDLAMQNSFAPSLPTALLNAFNTNNRINHYLIDHLPAAAWNASPPKGKGRTIQAIVAHMHNVRVMWLTSAAKGSKIPNQLDRAKVTAPQALRAMEQSREALSVVLGRAITADGHVKGFRPDAIGFLAYLIAHDAHHRGQIAMLARQVGHPLPQKVMFGMWEWNSR
jgi:uncharacterized damage-inducible protein DinB